MKLLIEDTGYKIRVDLQGKMRLSIIHYNAPGIYQLSKAFVNALERTDVETLTEILNTVQPKEQ